MMPENEGIFALKHAAKEAPKEDAPALWAKYHQRVRAEEARRDRLRVLNTAAANALGARLMTLRDVGVESTLIDDFGRVSFELVIRGRKLWTRPVELTDQRGYSKLRDAIAAERRKDWSSARSYLTAFTLESSYVNWNGFEQIRLDRNRYGSSHWR
jgi:hypothetical protein